MTSSIQHYLDQHNEIISLLDKLKIKIDLLSNKFEDSVVADSQEILSKISGNLKIHLAMEDKYLYPQLLSSHNPDVVSTAKMFMDEMGSLSSVFSGYLHKWSNPSKIKSDHLSFVSDTRGVIDAVVKRIDKENITLYPLIKSVLDNSGSSTTSFIGKILNAIKRLFGGS